MRTAIVIPARYASTRLPGKLLLEAAGKPLIAHVVERALRVRGAGAVVVAADDERIAAAVRDLGCSVAMTDPAHTSGSARAAEAARGLDADLIVNLQGDEPEIDPLAVERLIAVQAAHAPFCSTLVCPFPKGADPADPSAVKAVLGRRIDDDIYETLYFTRAPAPYARDAEGEHHLHIGVYAFRADSLQAFAAAPEGRLERIEKLEQLRILEMGERILAATVEGASAGVDTAGDFAAFRARVERGRRK